MAELALDPKTIWETLEKIPGGIGNRVADLFSKVYVPHSALMGFHLARLDEKSIEVTMPDRRSNRNHLSSLHAMALAHLGEFTCGALLLYAVMPKGYRTILTKYQIEYLAKARGKVTGRARLALPKGELDKKNIAVKAEITDRSGQVVAKVTTTWRVGKRPR